MSLWSVAPLTLMSVRDPEALLLPGAWAMTYSPGLSPTKKGGPGETVRGKLPMFCYCRRVRLR